MKEITESTVVKVISEALGVPEGILETSENLYDEFMKEFLSSYDEADDDGYEVDFYCDYKIGDLEINEASINIEIVTWKKPDRTEYTILGYATPLETSAKDSSGKLEIVSDFDKIKINIKILVPIDWTFEKLVERIYEERDDIVESFSHELMHVYENYNKGYDSAYERAEYNAYSNLSFGIPPIDQFLHSLYFTTAIENVVRPTEVAMAIKNGKVNQKTFLKFLLNHETYKMLDKARNFSYEKLRTDLKNYTDKIDEVGKHINHDMGSNDDEKIDEILRLVYVNLINKKGETYIDIMTSNIMEEMFGLHGEKKEKLKKFIKKINKFDNPKDFFENEEKLFKFVATKMIKKISKLYAMLKPEDKSIKEWDLYHEVYETNSNLDTEIKFKK